ncbi:MAG: protein kinase [Labilithrix sp.]|nr:protein kinase [Labilithrix sp.]MCW5811842.1 protein kinase [Labilithrix sp.]
MSDAFAPNDLIEGRYRVLERLGAGGMGVVYRAEDVLLARPAAIKVIGAAATTRAERTLLREARAVARLRHENVVQVYSFGSVHGQRYFAMEYVEGESVEELLVRMEETGETLPVETVLDIVTRIASGLSAAHAINLIHRDVKPSNVVIERATGRPVLIDFGIAREVGGAPSTRDSFLVAGTPSYMAPEQVRNDRAEIGKAVDLYALACMAFELLTGSPVFLSEDTYGLMHAHVSQDPPSVSSLRPELAAFDAPFARALAKRPGDRQESCDAFAAELNELAELVRAGQHVSAPPTSAVTSGGTAPFRALVLVDDRLERAVARRVARGHVARATEPQELLAAFERAPFDLVVMDDDAAGGVAMELVRLLRAMPDGDAARIAVVTRDMFADRDAWRALGVRRLAKPLNPRALEDTLDELCRPQERLR